jgi:hypothetical protein
VEVVPVDPRDPRWEVDSPAYRVYLWRPHGNGWESQAFELRNARDAREALDWASREADSDRIFTLYALVEQGGERGLVRVAGVDPTAEPLGG